MEPKNALWLLLVFGGFLMITSQGVLNNISGWIVILFSFLMLNPIKPYKRKIMPLVLSILFFLSWFVTINLSAILFIDLFKVEAPTGLSLYNVEIIFMGVVFLVILILSVYIFIYKLIQTLGLLDEINNRLEAKNISNYGEHCGEDD